MGGAQLRAELVLYGNGQRSQRACALSQYNAGCDGRKRRACGLETDAIIVLLPCVSICVSICFLRVCLYVCLYVCARLGVRGNVCRPDRSEPELVRDVPLPELEDVEQLLTICEQVRHMGLVRGHLRSVVVYGAVWYCGRAGYYGGNYGACDLVEQVFGVYL